MFEIQISLLHVLQPFKSTSGYRSIAKDCRLFGRARESYLSKRELLLGFVVLVFR